MAEKIIRVLTSDISGEEIADGKGETVTFALDNTTYEIDLTSKEADKFRGLFQDHIAAGRKVTSRSSGASTRRSSGSGRSKEELAEIRTWAQENGHTVSERGRIKQDIIDAFDAAQK